MATSSARPAIDQLRRMVLRDDGAGLTDGLLLEAFVRQKDESAFAALVRRHGPMVLGVCRRTLRHPQDAEDAFQATFLVLVRKASSIVPRERVANWLYGVAYRTSLKARTLNSRHQARERQVTEMPEPEADAADNHGHDLRPLLDQELSRLPDKYRVPLVLCELEGKTGKEAARQLGWPEGTVASRLSRGRALLAKRLTQRGVAVSAGALATVLSPQAACAQVPTSLASTTINAASALAAGQALTTGLVSAQVAALTEGVLRAMLLNKLQNTLVVCAVIGVLGIGWSGVFLRAGAADPPAVPQGAQQVVQAERTPVGKQAWDERRSSDEANQILEMVRKGLQAHQDRDQDKKAERRDQVILDVQKQAFLMAFQIASELAKADRKTALDDNKRTAEMAGMLWEIMEKALRPSDGKSPGPGGKEASDQQKEAFLTAYRVSSEIAKAMSKTSPKATATAPGRRTELELLEEIEKTVKELKQQIQERKERK